METAPGGAFAGVPRTPVGYLDRPRLTERLDRAAGRGLVIVRGAGGSGKSSLVAGWIAGRRDAAEPVLWVALDESSRSRPGFWLRVVHRLRTQDLLPADSPLRDFVTGGLDIARVRAIVLDELARHGVLRVVLDDLHVLDDEALEDLAWLIERAPGLRIVVTTRRRDRLEAPEVAARLDPVVIADDDLAFTVGETARILEGSAAGLPDSLASTIHAATGGRPLAVRVAVTVLREADDADTLTPDEILARIIDHTAEDLLPSFSDDAERDAALTLAIAPIADPSLARDLTGRADVHELVERFERAGLGTVRPGPDGDAFGFHPVVRAALERDAGHRLDPDRLAALRRLAAGRLAADDPIGSLSLWARLGETAPMWPIIARHFSDLINFQRVELLGVLRAIPADLVRADGALATALAVAESEYEPLPTLEMNTRVDTALARLHDHVPADGVDEFFTAVAELAAPRAARRYELAGEAGDRLISVIAHLAPEDRSRVGDALPTSIFQTIVTDLLLGRFGVALERAQWLVRDVHPVRTQHRRSLVAYAEAMRGDMNAAAVAIDDVRAARFDEWPTALPLMGWYAARALVSLESGDTEGALAAISALDTNLHEFEHWPYLLRIRALVRLAGPAPEIGVDELEAALAASRGRRGSRYALGLIAGIRSDLALATGHPARARTLAAAAPDPTVAPVVLARARVDLADGEPGRAAAAMRSLVGHAALSVRERAEALLVQALADDRLGLREEAERAVARALEIVERHGLRTPLMMVPRAEVEPLLGGTRPVLLDDLPDPFGTAVAEISLTPREQELLAGLVSAGTLEEVAASQHVSVNTVKTHTRHLYRKLGAASRAEAIAVARRRGLI